MDNQKDRHQQYTPRPKDIDLDEVYRWIASLHHLEVMGLTEKAVKLFEEGGELAAEILRLQKFKESKGEHIPDFILEEGCDVMITTLSIMAKLGFSHAQLTDTMVRKVNGWLQSIDAAKYQHPAQRAPGASASTKR